MNGPSAKEGRASWPCIRAVGICPESPELDGNCELECNSQPSVSLSRILPRVSSERTHKAPLCSRRSRVNQQPQVHRINSMALVRPPARVMELIFHLARRWKLVAPSLGAGARARPPRTPSRGGGDGAQTHTTIGRSGSLRERNT